MRADIFEAMNIGSGRTMTEWHFRDMFGMTSLRYLDIYLRLDAFTALHVREQKVVTMVRIVLDYGNEEMPFKIREV